MYRILKFLFTGNWHICEHKWKIIEITNLVDVMDRVKGTRYYLQCEMCGNIKHTK